MRQRSPTQATAMSAPHNWKLEATVRKFLASPLCGEWLVLLNWEHDGRKRFANLLCVDAAGAEQWRAHLPDATDRDTFMDVSVQDGSVIAATWSCFRIVIDAATGGTIGMEFTK